MTKEELKYLKKNWKDLKKEPGELRPVAGLGVGVELELVGGAAEAVGAHPQALVGAAGRGPCQDR